MPDYKEIKEIADLIHKFQPSISEQALEKHAQNIYELSLLMVRLQVKQHAEQPKPKINGE